MPSTARPPSIGEPSSGLLRIREQVPLPPKRDLVLTEIGRILGIGMVQKLVVEVGQPITYERFVRDDGEVSPELEIIEAQDLYSAARNAEVVDFKAAVTNPFEILFLAFRALESRRVAPKAFIGSNWITVRRWLKLSDFDDVGPIFGLPTYNHEEVPEDVLMLVGASQADPAEVSLSLRIPMDFPGTTRPLKKKDAECRNAGKVN